MELTRTAGAWILMGALVLGVFGLLPSQVAAQTPDLNNPDYWETQTVHESQCFKHEGDDLLSNAHGTSDGLTVTLNPFNPAWFGDHWELLVVKAGTGNEVYDHPTAGVPYPAFEGKEVSHWIVCKGLTPDTTTTETTTSSTQPTSTTTTTESTTTTETTVPSSTTSTTDPTTTTTPSSTTQPPTSVTTSTSVPPTTLPFTGVDDIGLYAGYAVALLSAGGLLILALKRR